MALPALQSSGQPQPYFGNGHANGHTNGHAKHPANAHMAVPIAMRTEEASQPILPPRTTGRMEASGTAKPASWKSWPVVVIGIAVIAIIVAVIIMVWPQSQAVGADGKTLAPPPAPERMDTNPVPPKSSQTDPWKGGAAPDPAPAQPSAPPSVPDIDDIVPPSDVDDPDSLGGMFRGNPMGQNMLAMTGAVLKHACDRLAQCPNGGDPLFQAACGAGTLMLPKTPPPSCQAAKRCLAKVDAMSCDAIDPSGSGMTMGLELMSTLPECIEAATSC